ncbi:helix-turn-helix transcriptional regulator [Kocuria rhizophila]|uniref:helix-turn-helix domain-containing protein n=1 Tax=Kocuria TaxID=57493 RepID=UPI00214F98F5|nr:helix-turn-helix transcriptional regulator [Kocuria rhizophila]MCR4526508.1 helix-turn-helix transcriptional regulator [Kocuria rhizophila]WIW68200.1 helix-turn-helix transcriptional regulator [Kocuria sp. ChxB]
MGQDASEETGREWGRELTRSIGQNVRRYRQNLGWSAQDLSNETKRRGYPIPRSTIANIEVRPKNTIALQEAIVLADSLGVSLATLLYSPYEPNQRVAVTPVWELPTYKAWPALSHKRSPEGGDLNQPAEEVRLAAQKLNGARVNLRTTQAELEKERAKSLMQSREEESDMQLQARVHELEWLAERVEVLSQLEREAAARLAALGVEPWPLTEHQYPAPPAGLSDFWTLPNG